MSTEPIIVDRTGQPLTQASFDSVKPSRTWPPITVTAAQIELLIQQLADHPRPANGRREAVLVHPNARDGAMGLAPGTQVVLSVLKPGEETTPVRQNSTQVVFCIRGSGRADIGPKQVNFQQYDVWNIPSFVPYRHINTGSDLQVRLNYSNAPLLEMLRVHMVDEHPDMTNLASPESSTHVDGDPRRS
jgi:gentisate 1,2-dioxygenase